eukprot:g16966.t1
MQPTGATRHCLLRRLALGMVAFVLLCRWSCDGNETFVPARGIDGDMSRRGLLAVAGPALLGGPGTASAMTQGITDVVEYMNRPV